MEHPYHTIAEHAILLHDRTEHSITHHDITYHTITQHHGTDSMTYKIAAHMTHHNMADRGIRFTS
eukprot:8285945-Pyramimonas_sp.AAC.1